MRSILLSILLTASFLVSAQAEMTEREVKREERFIEAKREALLGKTEEAISLFEALAEDEPDNDAALFELSRLRYAAERNDAAIEALREAYRLRPNDVYAAFLAELYQVAGRYRDGAELYAELVRRNPAEPENYLQQAAFLVRDQDVKGAMKVYEELEAEIGINAELSRRKHALYLGSGDVKRAERELLALIEAFPGRVDYRHLLAGFYSSQNEEKDARQVYEEILRMQPADVRAQLALQDAAPAAAGNSDDDALMALLGRSDVELDLKIGKLLPQIQQVANTQDRTLADRLLELTAELRRVHPDEAKAAAIEGDLYFHSGRPGPAAAAYRETLELDDTVFPVWEQLLASLYLTNQMAELRDYAEEALDIFPNRPSVYVQYALAEAFRADFDEADNLLQQAQLMVSGNPEAAAALRSVSDALTALRGEAGEGSVDAATLPGGAAGPLGFYLEQRADPDVTVLTAADTPDNTNALLLELMGDARSDAGDREAAAQLYARAKAAGSKSADLPRKISQLKS